MSAQHNSIKVTFGGYRRDWNTLEVHIFSSFGDANDYAHFLSSIPGVARIIEQLSDRYKCLVVIGELHDPIKVAADIVAKLAYQHLYILPSTVNLVGDRPMTEPIMKLVRQAEDAKMRTELQKEIAQLEAMRDSLTDNINYNLTMHVTPLRKKRVELNRQLKRRRAELAKVTAGK